MGGAVTLGPGCWVSDHRVSNVNDNEIFLIKCDDLCNVRRHMGLWTVLKDRNSSFSYVLFRWGTRIGSGCGCLAICITRSLFPAPSSTLSVWGADFLHPSAVSRVVSVAHIYCNQRPQTNVMLSCLNVNTNPSLDSLMITCNHPVIPISRQWAVTILCNAGPWRDAWHLSYPDPGHGPRSRSSDVRCGEFY